MTESENIKCYAGFIIWIAWGNLCYRCISCCLTQNLTKLYSVYPKPWPWFRNPFWWQWEHVLCSTVATTLWVDRFIECMLASVGFHTFWIFIWLDKTPACCCSCGWMLSGVDFNSFYPVTKNRKPLSFICCIKAYVSFDATTVLFFKRVCSCNISCFYLFTTVISIYNYVDLVMRIVTFGVTHMEWDIQ